MEHSYPVYFTRNALDPANDLLARAMGLIGAELPNEKKSIPGLDATSSELSIPSDSTLLQDMARTRNRRPVRYLIILDAGLLEARPGLQQELSSYFKNYHSIDPGPGQTIVLPGGEACKNEFSHLTSIYEAVARQRIDRHSYILAIGGGALIDVAGFAAATAHRGIRLIRIPTTVLAQNDASVGVKNGMNFAGRKNFIGSFAPPNAVINDFAFLDSLSDRDKRAGMAEAIKVALIRDGAFFQWMEAHAGQLGRFENWALEHLIFRCAELHLNQISRGGDPFESGSARPLDFGHWSAHKLEELSGHSIRHGEAVAMGMALDSIYSWKMGILEEKEVNRVLSLLRLLEFPLYTEFWNQLSIEQSLQEFREHLGGELCITLLEATGQAREVHTIDARKMHESLQYLQARFAKPEDRRVHINGEGGLPGKIETKSEPEKNSENKSESDIGSAS